MMIKRLDQGYLGENPVVVTIEDTSSIRIPSGNELGAWQEYWEPGGYTSGGVKGKDFRRALFAKEKEIFSLFGQDFQKRKDEEIEEILKKNPYNDI